MARATYREVLERRAKENSVDFIEGVATAITPLAILETVMMKGYQTLVDEDTTVSYRDGMEAALKLNEITRKDEGAIDRARMLADMGRIIEVVRTFIPSERWPDVQAALRGESPVSQQTSHAVEGVRIVPIDDTPDEDGNKQSNVLAALPKSAHPGALAALKEIYNAPRHRQGPDRGHGLQTDRGRPDPLARGQRPPPGRPRTQRRDLSQRQTTGTPDRHHPTPASRIRRRRGRLRQRYHGVL